MARSTWDSEREAAIIAAKQGGDVLAQWAGRFTTKTKGLNDLVTEADVAVQERISDTLLRKFPGDDFLGEEGSGDETKLNGSRRWIVDPIDGTTNFIHAFPFYCISIALEVDGELVVGVIYDPNRKECYSAAKGQGATCNASRLQVSSSSRLADSLINIGLRADTETSPEAMQAFVRVSGKSRSVRRLGSAALGTAYVAAGRLDAFVSHVIQPWDIAAGVVLVREAGGRVTNLRASQYNLYTRNILVSNGLIHEELGREC
ncbi:inositol monophosphatase [bacterium]|nr:inositol monophosphatase [bacterium]